MVIRQAAAMTNYCYSIPERRHVGPFRRTKTGIAVALLWITLSLFLAVLALISFLQPTWLYNDGVGSAGLQSFCIRKADCPVLLSWNFANVPSSYWKSVVILHVLACISFCLSPNLVMLAHCFEGRMKNRGFLFGGILQITGASLLGLACILFPLGWSAPPVKELCGVGSGAFTLNDCSLGWAYILAILSAIDALVLSIVVLFLYERRSHTRDHSVSQPLFDHSEPASSQCHSHSSGSEHSLSLS